MNTPSHTVTTPCGVTPVRAFALGGLAGSNAHGAGCLQATIDKWDSRTPQMISCTTGQIFWVCVYLKYLELLSSTLSDSCI
jgi:hypothetical protein